MERVLLYFKNYFRINKWYKIATDFLFYILLILLLIPNTRTLLIRAILIGPSIKVQDNAPIIASEDLNLELEDLEGNMVNLNGSANKNIFICFWATWCPPCRAEMPSIQKLYEKYGDRINFFLVTNEERSKVQSFLKEFGYTVPVYFQKSINKGKLDVQSLPTTFFIGKDYRILIRKKGAANWNSRIFRKKLEKILTGR